MHQFHYRGPKLVTLLCGLLGFCASPCLASETLTAILLDGRRVAGSVDAKTDQHYLWIRREESNIQLSSGFPWSEVQRGEVGLQRFTAHELRSWAQERKPNGHRSLETTHRQPEDRPPLNSPAPVVHSKTVRTMVIKAHLAQWDNDSQTDGLRILVWPLDAQGRIVPINGQIDLTLMIERENRGGSEGPFQQSKFEELERSHHILREKDFMEGPAVLELPFTKQHPDFSLNMATQALVHARLGISGLGVFEASDAQVHLRESSRLRDQLQLYSPQRYLPLESGGQWNR